jgi:hypothetical protein
MTLDNDKKAGSAKPRSDAYEYGYGKPPKAKQFKKGKSGNPAGRPKAAISLNARDAFERVLSLPARVRQGDKMVNMTYYDAIVAGMCAAAARGNTKAFELIGKVLSAPITLQDVMKGRKVFEWTEEEEARFTEACLLAGPIIDEEVAI